MTVGLLHRIARARLASQVIRRLRQAGVTDARYQSVAFAVRFTRPGADKPTVLPLDPLLAVAKRRRGRRARVSTFVTGYLAEPALPDSWDEVRPMLRPLLRPSHLRGGIPADGPDAPLRRSRLPFLSEFVVVDLPESMTYVGADQLSHWGVPADEVFAAACGNLTGAVLKGVAGEPTIVQFTGDDNAYWTSHLLLDGWLARLAPQVGGDPVAFAPDHATLIVAAAGSAHLPELFARSEMIYLASPRAITPMAYISDDRGRTVPFAPKPGDPMYQCVRRARIIQRVQEFTRQAETLPGAEALTLVAGLRTRTVARLDALLPPADEVDWDGAIMPWQEVVSALTRVPDLDPPRWTRRLE